MRKRSLFITILSVLLFVSTGMFFACNNGEPLTVTGMDSIQAEMTVQSGAIVEIPMPVIKDSEGNILDVWVEVVNSENGYVAVSENTFKATDIGGYTVRYVVKTSDGAMHTATTAVKVRQSAFDFEVKGFTQGKTEILTVGETVTFTADGPDGATYSYKVAKDGQTATDSDGEFTPTEIGKYVITATATLNGAQEIRKFDAYVRNASKIGEVEIFDDSWTDMARIEGDNRLADWSIAKTEDGAPKDRNGENGTYLLFSAKEYDSWIDVPLNPRNDADYYKNLAKKGYTAIVTWVYLDCEQYHEGGIYTDPNGGYYKMVFPAIAPKTWTPVSFHLTDKKNADEDSYRSFITCLEMGMYDGQKMSFMYFDNSGDYVSPHETEMKIYVSDFYAVADFGMTTGEDVFVEKSTGGNLTVDENAFDTTAYEDDFDFSWKLDGTFVGDEIPVSLLKTKKQPLDLCAVGKDSRYESVVYRLYVDAYDKNEVTDTTVARKFAEDLTQIKGSALEGWYKGNARTEYLEIYEGRTNVVKATSSQMSLGVLINPLHSAAYYDELIKAAEDKTYYYTFEYKIVSDTIHARYNYKETFNKDWVSNRWYTETVKLSDLLNYIDEMAENYAMANSYPSGNFDALLTGVYNNGIKTEIYVTMPQIVAVEELTEIEGTVKLAEKSATSVTFDDFDKDNYADYDLIWYVNGEETETVNPSTMNKGVYKINVYAKHKLFDIGFSVYKTTLDVYDDTPEFVSGSESVIGTDLANWDDGNAKTSVLDEKYNGKTVVKVTGTKAKFGVTVNPMHSKAYYEQLRIKAKAEGKEYYVSYSYKIEMSSSYSSPTYGRYDYLGNTQTNSTSAAVTWQNEIIKLSELIDSIDEMRYKFENANKLRNKQANHKGLLSGVYNNYYGCTIYVTVPVLTSDTSSIETVDGGVKLVKNKESLNFNDLFDTTAIAVNYDLTWKADGETVTAINPSEYSEGLHSVELTAKNKLSGAEVIAYRATLDIYDENNVTFVKDLSDVLAARSFAGWGASVENLRGNTYDGNDVVTVKSKGETRLALIANLAHSYEYYKYVAESDKNYKVSVECYIPSTANSKNWTAYFNHAGVESNRANTLKGVWKEDRWVTLTISLSDFLGQIKEMQSNYSDATSHQGTVNGNSVYNYSKGRTTGQFFGFYLPGGGDDFTMYVKKPQLVTENG